MHGEIFWDARLAINGDTLYIAGGNALAKIDDGTFPGPDSQDFFEGDKFPVRNYFGAVSAINIKTKKSTLIATGLRHLGGMYYDATRKVLWESENGPRGGDELNIISAGANYGWPVATKGIDYTGARVSPYTAFSGMQAPVWGWTPSIAPAGMTLYRGELFPQWQGNIFVAALAAKSVHRLQIENHKVVSEQVLFRELKQRIRDVRSGPDGALYLLTDSDKGQLIKVTP